MSLTALCFKENATFQNRAQAEAILAHHNKIINELSHEDYFLDMLRFLENEFKVTELKTDEEFKNANSMKNDIMNCAKFVIDHKSEFPYSLKRLNIAFGDLEDIIEDLWTKTKPICIPLSAYEYIGNNNTGWRVIPTPEGDRHVAAPNFPSHWHYKY